MGNAFLSHVRSVDGIFQVVRAFDDDEVTHVEGDVNPIRDMEIIQTELRLKDIEWVQKQLEGNRKSRALGNSSLADKARKEEIVCESSRFTFWTFVLMAPEATTEKVLKVLSDENKDVRKAEWTNKEVCYIPFIPGDLNQHINERWERPPSQFKGTPSSLPNRTFQF